MSDNPAIQLIANVIVHDGGERILLVRYDPSDEIDETDADTRWWLPAHELEAYEHPDQAARIAVDEIVGVDVAAVELSRVQSFRGRRGWHISFDYVALASGQPEAGPVPARWFERDTLPRTMHGNWEAETIEAALA